MSLSMIINAEPLRMVIGNNYIQVCILKNLSLTRREVEVIEKQRLITKVTEYINIAVYLKTI